MSIVFSFLQLLTGPLGWSYDWSILKYQDIAKSLHKTSKMGLTFMNVLFGTTLLQNYQKIKLQSDFL